MTVRKHFLHLKKCGPLVGDGLEQLRLSIKGQAGEFVRYGVKGGLEVARVEMLRSYRLIGGL